ncbi:MAG: hypothetical protein ACRBB0_15215 [Pelagimonas sp.]|uniref:hypothetical protein n=1 Tax=Pelagimonas sp. TaxID=2073170 RepID=UPI003D6A8EC7
MPNVLSLYAAPQEPEQFRVGSFAAPIQQKQFMNALAGGGMFNGQAKVSEKNMLAGMAQQPAGKSTEPSKGGDWLKYTNQSAIRNGPISGELMNAMSFLGDMGIEMRVFSGGQAPKGSGGPRTGSVRHDHGNAADAFFFQGGRKLDWNDPNDRPIFEEIVARAKANGVTGIGAGDGYMQPGSMHVGFGKPAVWGAGGKGANAPDWLRSASARGIEARRQALADIGL